METLRVLLIERDRARAESMQRALLQSPLARFQLDHAESAEALSRSAGTAPPDVVVLDVRHTDGSAPGAVAALRQAFPGSALVLVGDPQLDGDGSGTDDIALCVIGTHAERGLDRVALAAAARNRRLLELQRRVRELEVGEHNLRMLVSTTTDGIMIVDMNGRICFANPAAQQLFGRDSDELIGEPFGFPLVAGDTTLIDIVRRDNDARVVELRTTETEWEGEPARLAALRDITERVKAEEQARELVREHTRRKAAEQSERRTRLLSEATRLLASTLDGTRALQELADLIVPALVDCCLIDLVEPDAAFRRAAVAAHGDAASLIERLREGRPRFHSSAAAARALRDGEPWAAADCADPDFVAALGLPDGKSPIAKGAARGVLLPLTARGEAVGAMLLIRFGEREALSPAELLLAREIAQRAAVALDNARLYRQAQEAARAKADFLAVMSHELRTPLNAIIGYAELLMIGVPEEVPPSSHEQVGRIRASAGHLLRLINEILNYSSLEDGRAELELVTASVGELIQDVAAMLEPLAGQKGLALRVELPTSPISLETDPHKLRQILLNLLGNAIKFTDAGAVIVRVTAEVQDVVISIHDTGCGIAAQDLERIFHPFWQAEQSRTRRTEGTGLGLAVARRLAHLLAGEITVEAVPGDGSEFTVRLPWRYPRNRQP